jgi:hypothetical protein
MIVKKVLAVGVKKGDVVIFASRLLDSAVAPSAGVSKFH